MENKEKEMQIEDKIKEIREEVKNNEGGVLYPKTAFSEEEITILDFIFLIEPERITEIIEEDGKKEDIDWRNQWHYRFMELCQLEEDVLDNTEMEKMSEEEKINKGIK